MKQPLITIVIPISRQDHAKRIMGQICALECDKSRTSLLVGVDDSPAIYNQLHPLVVESGFANATIINHIQALKKSEFNAVVRRQRTAAMHNVLRENLIWKTEYVLGVEDDCCLPTGLLRRLVNRFFEVPDAGFVSGIQVGRKTKYLGAWKFDDVHMPKRIESLVPSQGLVEVDAAGLYAFMAKAENYLSHNFAPREHATFGADIGFGLTLRRIGLRNYVDMDLPIGHYGSGNTILMPDRAKRVILRKNDKGAWRFTDA